MSARDALRRHKTAIQASLCGDYRLILNKVLEKDLITAREYTNLKSINQVDVEGHVVELVDKLMNKSEDTCQQFLNLLQTDEDIGTTYPELRSMQLSDARPLPEPVQECALDLLSPESKRPRKEDHYRMDSQPVGLCVIINNENFVNGEVRRGTNKDAQCLAEVFSWLRFRVLMCKDQTQDQMERTLDCFASLSDHSQPQEFDVKEWLGAGFGDPQQAPRHGDAFICCILSHGARGVVFGTDWKPLAINQITRTFKTTDQSALVGKPKVFLIQACQGGTLQRGVFLKDLESDDAFIPEAADILVAIATVKDHASVRHRIDGTWFVQSAYLPNMTDVPQEDETSAGAVAGIGGPGPGEDPKASDEAIAFMSSIEPAGMLKCVFPDSLVTASECGRELGKFSVTVEFACRLQQPCILLHAQSQGVIDDAPCGTTVTAYLSTNLEVLEEDYREYVKLEGHGLEKRCHMVQHKGKLVINKVTTVGESELGLKQLDVGGETVEVFGMERTVHSVEDSPTTWQCYFLDDGHLASRVQVGSPVTMRLLRLPSQPEQGFEKIPLVWEDDMQMHSQFLDRKDELKADHTSYLKQNPDIRALISDFLQFLLLRKPDDVFQFARDYFLPFASHRPPESTLKASSL
ncbi:hypothetical protein F2P81_000939 [Scophthalmus maximus]|uniref:Ciliogenesis-associated TTC17-interacting protein n=1 Tax=Scophthalmus maximus TaxID=52904 RepID=A0A6A4TIC7_SCOMX|nr:hypothetical protein F2P81_000939 [Scophthalmus maximus]